MLKIENDRTYNINETPPSRVQSDTADQCRMQLGCGVKYSALLCSGFEKCIGLGQLN